MRRGFGIVWALVTLLIAGVVGALAYQAGLSTQIASSGAAAGAVYPWHYWGFGFFPFFGLFPLFFFLLLLFFLFRGPWWWHRGQGGRGHLEDRMKEWHEREHGRAPSGEEKRS